MTPLVVVTLSDAKDSSFLKDKFKLDALLTYLKEIEQSNPSFARVDFQNKQTTKLYTSDRYEISKLNERSVMSLPGMDPEQPLTPSVSLITCKTEEHAREMMERMQRLCSTMGELRYFHYEREFQCHIGGFEDNINAVGMDGVFLLVFSSSGIW